MRFHGIWDKYEMYDIEKDPKEMDNLLGGFLQRNESGTLDQLIRRTAEADVKDTFLALDKRLNELLDSYGCAREPNWVPLGQSRN